MKYRKNVIITPHTARISKQAIARMDLEIANKMVEANYKLLENEDSVEF